MISEQFQEIKEIIKVITTENVVLAETRGNIKKTQEQIYDLIRAYVSPFQTHCDILQLKTKRFDKNCYIVEDFQITFFYSAPGHKLYYKGKQVYYGRGNVILAFESDDVTWIEELKNLSQRYRTEIEKRLSKENAISLQMLDLVKI